MGAHGFETVEFGRTVSEAYGRAVEQALYEYGHDGYNGTISTTNGYTLVEVPKGLTSKQFMAMAWALEAEPEGDGIAKPPIRRKFEGDWDRQHHEEKKALAARWARLSVVDQAKVRQAARFRKWEACTAFRLPPGEAATERKHLGAAGKQGDVFCFFGLAAS